MPPQNNAHAAIFGLRVLVLRVTCASVAALLLIAASTDVEAQRASAVDVKSAAIRQLIQMVEWPEDAFLTPSSSLVIGYVGRGATPQALRAIVDGEVHGHPAVVEHYPDVASIMPCHVLIIAESEEDRIDRALGVVAGLRVLTVSEVPDFVERGGMIELGVDRARLNLGVNAGAARREGLVLDEEIVALANRVVR